MKSILKTLAPLALVLGVSAASAAPLIETSYPEGFQAQPTAASVSGAASGSIMLLNNEQGVLPVPFVSSVSRDEVRAQAGQKADFGSIYFN
jgi:hypothetical protein